MCNTTTSIRLLIMTLVSLRSLWSRPDQRGICQPYKHFHQAFDSVPVVSSEPLVNARSNRDLAIQKSSLELKDVTGGGAEIEADFEDAADNAIAPETGFFSVPDCGVGGRGGGCTTRGTLCTTRGTLFCTGCGAIGLGFNGLGVDDEVRCCGGTGCGGHIIPTRTITECGRWSRVPSRIMHILAGGGTCAGLGTKGKCCSHCSGCPSIDGLGLSDDAEDEDGRAFTASALSHLQDFLDFNSTGHPLLPPPLSWPLAAPFSSSSCSQ